MKLKEESEKAGLKLNIQKNKKIPRSVPSICGEYDRKGKAEAVTDFIFSESKITADLDYSHGIKRCLLLGRKTMVKLDSV